MFKPVFALVGNFYAPTSYSVVGFGDECLVKFYDVDFSAPSEQTTRSRLVSTFNEQGYSVEEEFTDLYVKKVRG